MRLEEAIKLGKHLESTTCFIKNVKHVSDIKKDDDISKFVCIELKHKSPDVSHDIRELYFIELEDEENNKYELYSNIINYLIKNHSEYYDIRLEMIVIKDIESSVIKILNNCVVYNQIGTIPVKLTFRFNNMYNIEILVLMQKNFPELDNINNYIKENSFLDYNIECTAHIFPY